MIFGKPEKTKQVIKYKGKEGPRLNPDPRLTIGRKYYIENKEWDYERIYCGGSVGKVTGKRKDYFLNKDSSAIKLRLISGGDFGVSGNTILGPKSGQGSYHFEEEVCNFFNDGPTQTLTYEKGEYYPLLKKTLEESIESYEKTIHWPKKDLPSWIMAPMVLAWYGAVVGYPVYFFYNIINSFLE